MTVKDTLKVDFKTMTTSISSDCDVKYARMIIQDYLKNKTPYKGGWELWRENDFETDGRYHFRFTNYPAGLTQDLQLLYRTNLSIYDALDAMASK